MTADLMRRSRRAIGRWRDGEYAVPHRLWLFFIDGDLIDQRKRQIDEEAARECARIVAAAESHKAAIDAAVVSVTQYLAEGGGLPRKVGHPLGVKNRLPRIRIPRRPTSYRRARTTQLYRDNSVPMIDPTTRAERYAKRVEIILSDEDF